MTTSPSTKKYTTKLLKNEIGHWKSKVSFNPSDHFGFLYCIQNKITKQIYWGKKQFWRGGLKKSSTYGKEMPWRVYVGSSEHLKLDLKNQKKSDFVFEIVDVYNTKGGLYYAEAYCQMVSESMTEKLEDNKTPRFYNRQIAAIRFVPKESISVRTRSYLKTIKGKY